MFKTQVILNIKIDDYTSNVIYKLDGFLESLRIPIGGFVLADSNDVIRGVLQEIPGKLALLTTSMPPDCKYSADYVLKSIGKDYVIMPNTMVTYLVENLGFVLTPKE